MNTKPSRIRTTVRSLAVATVLGTVSHLQRVVEQYGHRSESSREGPGRPRYVAAYLGRHENVRL